MLTLYIHAAITLSHASFHLKPTATPHSHFPVQMIKLTLKTLVPNQKNNSASRGNGWR